jgi:hypothetical protein
VGSGELGSTAVPESGGAGGRVARVGGVGGVRSERAGGRREWKWKWKWSRPRGNGPVRGDLTSHDAESGLERTGEHGVRGHARRDGDARIDGGVDGELGGGGPRGRLVPGRTESKRRRAESARVVCAVRGGRIPGARLEQRSGTVRDHGDEARAEQQSGALAGGDRTVWVHVGERQRRVRKSVGVGASVAVPEHVGAVSRLNE